MHVLWAPWRMAYIGGARDPGCFFCQASTTDDPRRALMLQREPALVMLNRFPYANGHVMVAPRAHTADFIHLPREEVHSLAETVQQVVAKMREVFRCDGFNVGLNLGQAGGAGVADHMHWHIVPRWLGDTNFMPMLADVRVMSDHLEAVYDKLKPLFQAT